MRFCSNVPMFQESIAKFGQSEGGRAAFFPTQKISSQGNHSKKRGTLEQIHSLYLSIFNNNNNIFFFSLTKSITYLYPITPSHHRFCSIIQISALEHVEQMEQTKPAQRDKCHGAIPNSLKNHAGAGNFPGFGGSKYCRTKNVRQIRSL